MRAIAWIYAALIGILAANALYSLCRYQLAASITQSLGYAFLAFIPVVGNAAGVYAANQVWGWSIGIGFAVFFLSVLVVWIVTSLIDEWWD